jgi:hypothetical protein
MSTAQKICELCFLKAMSTIISRYLCMIVGKSALDVPHEGQVPAVWEDKVLVWTCRKYMERRDIYEGTVDSCYFDVYKICLSVNIL